MFTFSQVTMFWLDCISLLKKLHKIYYFNLNFQTTNLIKISTYPIWKVLEKSRRKLRLNAGYFVFFFFFCSQE